MILIAILIPWLTFLLRGKILSGILCLILQIIIIIGWLLAAIWAIVSRNNAIQNDKLEEMERRIINAQNKI